MPLSELWAARAKSLPARPVGKIETPAEEPLAELSDIERRVITALRRLAQPMRETMAAMIETAAKGSKS